MAKCNCPKGACKCGSIKGLKKGSVTNGPAPIPSMNPSGKVKTGK